MKEKDPQRFKFKFLDTEDLDPDFEPNKDTEKETPPVETKPEDTSTETPPDPVPEPPKPPDTPIPAEEQAFVVAGRTYKSTTELTKALEHANAKLTEQGAELGTLRKLTEEREPKPSETEEEPPYDPYDQEALETWLAWKQRQTFQSLQAKRDAEEAKIQQQKALETMLGTFASSHPDLSPEEMVEVAGEADRIMRGENIMDVAFAHWSRNQNTPEQKTIPEPKVDKTKSKMEVADKLTEKPTGGGGKGSAELTADRIDSMTDAEYGKLPRAIRDKYLAGDL